MLSLAGKGANGAQLLEQKVSVKEKLLHLYPGYTLMRIFASYIEKRKRKY